MDKSVHIPIISEIKGITNYGICKPFNEVEIERILEIVSKYKLTDGEVVNSGYNELKNNIRKCRICRINIDDKTKWIFARIIECVKKINKMWNFSIHSLKEGQYIEYKEGDKFDWHIDIGDTHLTRKISISLQLSREDEYEGCELQFHKKKK